MIVERCQVIIKSFLRFDCLFRCIESLWETYPGIHIVIADDSLKPGELYPAEIQSIRKNPLVTWLQLPFDVGLSAGRNVAVQNVTKPIVIICDDDFVFTDEAKIERLVAVLDAEPEISLACGCLQNAGQDHKVWWGGWIELDGKRLKMTPLDSPWKETGGVKYRETDCGYNWFAARTESLLASPWDDRLYVNREHMSFFVGRKMAGLKSAYTPDSCIHHHPEYSGEYGNLRAREAKENRIFFEKWGIDSWDWIPHGGPIGEPLPDAVTIHRPADAKNIIIMGVGHSGTTILTRMLNTLGWHGGTDEWCEIPEVRALNEAAYQGELDTEDARRVVESLPMPWVIKDPRFCQTLSQWRPVLSECEPFLLWITRDPAEVEKSYARRGEGAMTRGLSRAETLQLAEQQYREWPWGKATFRYEDLAAAVALFRERPKDEAIHPGQELRIDIGGGGKPKPGFLNVDALPSADVRVNLEEGRLPFHNNSVAEVHSAHCFEHVRNLNGLLAEIARVCRVGAKVTITVPHWNQSMAMCAGHVHTISEHSIRHWEEFAADWFPGSKRLKIVSRSYAANEHFPEAKRLFPKLTDEQIFHFIADTCHEITHVFEVVPK